MQTVETDYLIIGAGASAMAFVDTLLEYTDARITMVDRRPKPGGHWIDAYPFVRLHQPSSYYGVASMPLGKGKIDPDGLNAGFEELATGEEIVTYFQHVMDQRLLPSGRVEFLAQTEYQPDGTVCSFKTGESRALKVNRRLVDCSICENTIPATHQRNFSIEENLVCIPPNDLPLYASDASKVTILGAGKTAMDAIVWLIANGHSPEEIAWIMPRDPWLTNRAFSQPTSDFFFDSYGGTANMLEAFRDAKDADDFALRMEKAGLWFRIDRGLQPEIMHGPTISEPELLCLRSVKQVIRKGRAMRITAQGLHLENGFEAMPSKTLYVDCTASALSHVDTWPVFTADRIGVQMVRLFQPCFSAALIARVEAMGLDDVAANRLLTPLPMTDSVPTWISAQMGSMMNQAGWMQVPELKDWIKSCRLDGFGRAARGVDRTNAEIQSVFDRIKSASMPALGNMQNLMSG